jgi:hypothetical protein
MSSRECGPFEDGYISIVVADETRCPDTTAWVVDLEFGRVACIAER